MKKHPLICTMTLMTFLYVFQFIFIPLIQRFWWGADITFFPSLFIIFGVGMFFMSDKLSNWFLSGLLYLILVFIYHGNGLYGIGMVGMNLDDAQASYRRDAVAFGIAVLAIIIIIAQILTWITVKLVKSINKLFNKSSTTK